jgi:hypothetical protein
MMSLILMLAMTNLKPAATVAQVQPCVWPHTCTTQAPALLDLAQVQTCQWPHTCGGRKA